MAPSRGRSCKYRFFTGRKLRDVVRPDSVYAGLLDVDKRRYARIEVAGCFFRIECLVAFVEGFGERGILVRNHSRFQEVYDIGIEVLAPAHKGVTRNFHNHWLHSERFENRGEQVRGLDAETVTAAQHFDGVVHFLTGTADSVVLVAGVTDLDGKRHGEGLAVGSCDAVIAAVTGTGG